MTDNIEAFQAKAQNEQLEEIYKGISAYQKAQDTLEEEGKGNQVKTDATLKKISEEVSTLMQAKQDLEVKNKTQEDEIKALEAAFQRAPAGDNKDDSPNKEYIEAFKEYIIEGSKIEKETAEKYHLNTVCKAFAREGSKMDYNAKALATDIGSNGGYFITPERLDKTITRNFETDPMRLISMVVPTSSTSIEMIIDDQEIDELQKPGENEGRDTNNNPQIGILEIHTHEIYERQAVTQKMLDHFPRIEQFLLDKINSKFARKENQLFVSGSGSSEAKGFLSYGEWADSEIYERDKLSHTKSGQDGVIVADPLIELQNSLHEVYQPSAVWLTKRVNFTDIMQLKGGQGRYLFDMNSMLKTGTDKILLGKRLLFSDNIEKPGVKDGKAIADGDFGVGYTIVDALGMTILRDPFTDEPRILFKARKRVGGALTSYDSIKILKLSA